MPFVTARPFSRTKHEAEAMIAGRAADFVILRPGFVLAPTAYGGSALLRAVACLPFSLSKETAGAAFRVTHADDLAATVVRRARQVAQRAARMARHVGRDGRRRQHGGRRHQRLVGTARRTVLSLAPAGMADATRRACRRCRVGARLDAADPLDLAGRDASRRDRRSARMDGCDRPAAKISQRCAAAAPRRRAGTLVRTALSAQGGRAGDVVAVLDRVGGDCADRRVCRAPTRS